MTCRKLFRPLLFSLLLLLIVVLPACVQKKTLKTMNNAERSEAKGRYLTEKNTDAAIKALELMLKESTDFHERRDIQLELADLLFDHESFDKAGKIYQEFVMYYGGSEKTEYASYRAVLCAFKGIASADRDQTKTIEAIELAKNFLDRAVVFTTYLKDVEQILAACQQRLFESEMNVVNFYISRGRYVSAARRIEAVRKQFIPLIKTAEYDILICEQALAEGLNNPELVLAKQAELIQKFPEMQQTIVAHNGSEKKRFVNRF